MKEDEDPKKRLICIDTGTTNTRVWLIEDGQILARAHAEVGVRDTAREGTSNRLTRALSELIAEVRIKAPDGGPEPEMVIASGMITSSLGLAEVPHVAAPAGIHELAAGAEKQFFPRITDLPVLLVPGVRSGPPEVDEATVRLTDLMRGEETLCQGLVRLKTVQQPGLVLNLGSHWKAIRIDAEGRISGSLTSLSGEMIYATITQTILASSVPRQRTEQIDEHWIEAGMNEQRQTGLARALFCVRLHEQAKNGSPEQRLSFLIGAFISSELDSLIKNCDLKPDDLVVIAGTGALAEAWKFALNKHAIETRLLSAEETEAALLAGMCWVESVTGQLDLASK